MNPAAAAAGAPAYHWLADGAEFVRRLLRGISVARVSIRFEVYIFADDDVGRRVRGALQAAVLNGVRVRVLLDALGSSRTADGFWRDFERSGGELRWFNPLNLRRFPVRNHRKLFVADDRVGGVGGFNVAEEYSGDGVTRGWADVGMTMTGPAVAGLAGEFDRMWRAAANPERLGTLFRRGGRLPAQEVAPGVELLAMSPGRPLGAFQAALRPDLEGARDILLVVAYFLPTRRMRQLLREAALRGARVRIVVPGKIDVELSRRAARHLYGPLLRKGVEIFEYQPQVLHAKLYVADRVAYVGSSNLDTRSLHINHELMLRLADPAVVQRAWEIAESLCARSRRVDPEAWRNARGPWTRLRDWLAYWLLARADPYLSRWFAREPR